MNFIISSGRARAFFQFKENARYQIDPPLYNSAIPHRNMSLVRHPAKLASVCDSRIQCLSAHHFPSFPRAILLAKNAAIVWRNRCAARNYMLQVVGQNVPSCSSYRHFKQVAGCVAVVLLHIDDTDFPFGVSIRFWSHPSACYLIGNYEDLLWWYVVEMNNQYRMTFAS